MNIESKFLSVKDIQLEIEEAKIRVESDGIWASKEQKTIVALNEYIQKMKETENNFNKIFEDIELCKEIAALSLEIRHIEEAGYPENTRHYVNINDRRHEALTELDNLRNSTKEMSENVHRQEN